MNEKLFKGEEMPKDKKIDSKAKKQNPFETTLWQAADKLLLRPLSS